MTWETVIGLEVHVQLNTKSKIFSGAATKYGSAPNSQACLIDLGYPGVLPVLNEYAVTQAIKFGLSINAEINSPSIFARKNYFYPDLPKGYQISQFEIPIVGKGSLNIYLEDKVEKIIGITRAHLEEDAGKSLHEDFAGRSGIDLNRAGTPLLEVVSEPDMRSAEEAVLYLKTLHNLIRYIDISDGNMQEGSFRCDANISVRKLGTEKLGTRAEIKNVNSFRFVERAINFEVARQIGILESGGTVAQETRLYDANKNETRPMRSKEEANDYRYFPDPDLLPVELDAELISQLKQGLPELPEARLNRFCETFQLSRYDASVITSSKELADYFEQCISKFADDPKLISNWLTSELLGRLNKEELKITECPVTAENFAGLLARIHDETISGKIAKTVFNEMWNNQKDADSIINQQGLKQITDASEIEKIIDEIIANFPKQVEQYKNGQQKLFGFFVGKAMKATKGKANPKQVNDILKEKLR